MPIYHDSLSDRQFKIGYWLTTHRVSMRKMGILILFVISVGLVLYGGWGMFRYYVLDSGSRLAIEKSIGAAKLNGALLGETSQPKGLQVVSANAFRRADGKIDLLGQIINPNTTWAVSSFDYYFLSGSQKTDSQTDFILPGQTKYALQLNYAGAVSFDSPQLILENIKWNKVSNYQAQADTILQIDTANQVVTTGKKSGGSAKESIGNIQFDLINHSAYSFWSPRMVILLYRGDSLIDATSTVPDSLSANEIKKINLNLFQTVSDPTKFVVVPDINILDSSVFKGFNTTGEAK
ncbi:MAG: hypothetical protein V1763_02980 [Parcubacteria group bacterium]